MAGGLRGSTAEADTYMELYLQCRGLAYLAKGPLLMVGMPHDLRWRKSRDDLHQCGDVCLYLPGISPHFDVPYRGCRVPVLAEGSHLPFKDGTFKYTVCSHLLAHLRTVQQAKVFTEELARVSEETAYLIPPGPLLLGTSQHYLSIRQRGGKLEAVARETGETVILGGVDASYKSAGGG